MENKQHPLVSVIVVNYNGKNLLENCFQSISQINYPNYEVLLIDNNSTDDSIEFVKNNYSSAIIIKLEKNYGFAYPNNVGAKNARGDYFLFLNNDTKVTPNFIDELVKAMEDEPKVGICQSMLLKPNGDVDSSGDFIDLIGVAFSSKEKISKKREILSAKGASMMVRKEVFEKLDGFDEKFFISFEDVDLGWRAWIMGYKVLVIPQSVVYHLGGQTITKAKPDLAFHGLKNQMSMKITNFETRSVVNVILKFIFIYGFRMLHVLLDYSFKGKTSIAATNYENSIAQKPSLNAILKSFGWLLTNLGYLSKKQKLLNKNRVYKTNDLIKRKVIIK